MENVKEVEQMPFTHERVAKGFRAAFRASLHSHQVDVNALSAGDINALNEAVFRVVLEDGEFDTGCYLRPQPSKTSLRNCFVSLSAEVASHCDGRPDYVIDYILQGLGSISLYNLIESDLWNKQDSRLKEQQFRSYFSIGRNENSLNWARHASHILSSKHHYSNGLIKFHRSKEIINALYAGDNFSIFSLSMVNVSDGETKITYASIFNILGIVARFLSILEGAGITKENKPNINFTTIYEELTQHQSVLTVSIPPWDSDVYKGDKDLKEFSERTDKNLESLANKPNKNLESLAGNIVKWLESTSDIKKEIKPSAVFLGKVWTRLYFSLVSVAENHRDGYASIMELYALCLINAFLVEEYYYHYRTNSTHSVDRTNPDFHDIDSFITKLNGINIEQFPLTRIIVTCPITLGLIKSHNVKRLTILQPKGETADEERLSKLGWNDEAFKKLDDETAVFVNNNPTLTAKVKVGNEEPFYKRRASRK